jgi:hypothetical protein
MDIKRNRRKPLRIGDRVRLRPRVMLEFGRVTSRIQSFIPDIQGGVVLSDYIGGFRCWNVLDLRRARNLSDSTHGA